ncbi:hypothetical protein GCM10007242_44970 [Pigmentiphaga litoralis]|uniref:DUF192 domain-containing protein n=1 Tax=Pigmentiphaga litoralis TaxID=516702 RepID=UPI00167A47E1|nr:DUF192 domain-containing protein [Pigmentiphaga litoralis]GGX32929.1 hypothetical protein GCM10007242_44970 [Pigmentiphaga litoralis]
MNHGLSEDHAPPQDPLAPRPANAGQPVQWRHARTFRARLIGLLGQPPLQPHEALRITPCAAVHTFGMRQAIDVVFVGRGGMVLAVLPQVPPWRIVWRRGALEVVETAAGCAQGCGLHAGAWI